jgi:hypothetical protein
MLYDNFSQKMELEESGKSNEHPPTWSQQFTRHGGLRHLFDIFMSGKIVYCLPMNVQFSTE